MKTHLVSQVLLKEFTNDAGLLTIHYKDASRPPETKSTKEACYIEIETEFIERLEKYWNESIESDTKKTLRILKAGDVLNYEKHINILKKLMALHYIRSWVLMDIFAELGEYHTNLIIEETMRDFSKSREEILKLVRPVLPGVLNKVLVDGLDRLIKKVDTHIEKFGLEIGVAPEGTNFILSDSPAIVMDKSGRLGPKEGVAIMNASEFAMVMTPKHVVALKSGKQAKTYMKLTARQVRALNDKQIKHSLSEYYQAP